MSQSYDRIKRDPQDVVAAQTDVVVIAAVAGKRIRVLAVAMSGDTAATTALFESNGTTALTGTLDVSPSSPMVLPYNDTGWFETLAGETLTVTTGAGGGITTQIEYAEV